MKNIVTHLWYDTQAVEAAGFYTSLFRNSSVRGTTVIQNTPSGSLDIVDFDLGGQSFTAFSAGPMFTFNPAISFLVDCDAAEEVDRLYHALAESGETMMALDSYPFSDRYAWVQDRYGLSWQLYFKNGSPRTQYVTPTLMFSGGNLGNAEPAMEFYASVFSSYGDSGVEGIARYGNETPGRDGMVMHAAFRLKGQMFYAMDSGVDNDQPFNEAISLLVNCDTQEEIDDLWDKLSAVPESEQCGWLKDKYGVSWQIVPSVLAEMIRNGNSEQRARVTDAFLQMKKFDLAALERAYRG